VKAKFEEALSEKYEVTVGSVERGWVPGRVYFNNVAILTRKTKPDELVTRFDIKRIEIDVGIMSLIGGTISVDIDAEIGDKKEGFGHLIGELEIEKFGRGSITLDVTGESLPGALLPMRGLLGLPMTGKLEFSIAAHLPVEKSKLGRTAINWQKATGSVSLTCPSSCTFGDGKTKLKPLLKNTRNQVMVGEGIDFGKVTMDTLVAKATMAKGKLTLDKFDTTSKDGQLKIDYMMTLDKEFSESMVAGCLRFKGSDDLLRREPKTHAAISTTGAELRSDGLFHIRLSDRFKDMKRLNQECGPNTNTGNGEDFSRTSRPNLTVTPETGTGEVTRPTMPATPTTPTPMPPDVPPPTAAVQDGGMTPITGSAAAPPGGPPGIAAPAPPGERGDGGKDHQPHGSGGSQTGDQPAPPPTPPQE
jgi:type II secretion system protein N